MKIKRTIAITLAVGVMATMGVAYAATAKTPAEIAASVTGKAVSEVTAERSQGKTYGAIAQDAGKLDAFKAQMLEQRKALFDQRVKDGKMTQAQADAIYNNFKNNQAACDASGSARMGKQGCASTAGQGCGIGRGGNGQGMGDGQGMGRGR